LPHNNYKKNIRKEKEKWRRDLTKTIGAYERLGLLELRARAVSHQLKKRWRKVEDGKIYELFSYLLNNFLKRGKGLRVDDLVVKWIKKLTPLKKGRELLSVYTTIR